MQFRIITSVLICGISFIHHSLFAQTAYSLQSALQTAKVNNTYLKTQKYNIQIAESDIITSRLRPNLTLNNQTLQLSNSSYFPQNANWSDGSTRQVWWQLTKSVQLPAQRKYKIDYQI